MKYNLNKILENIPYDNYVSASEIAGKTALSTMKVAHLISQKLLYVHVERTRAGLTGTYKYRRMSAKSLECP